MQTNANNETLCSAATLPTVGFVRLKQILTVIPIGKSAWWAGVKDGKYPSPVRPSPFGRVTVWRVEDIHALLSSCADGNPAGRRSS